MNRFAALRCIRIALLLVITDACVTWQPGWEMLPLSSGDAQRAQKLAAIARTAALVSDSKQALEEAIDLYQQALTEDPENVEALIGLAEYSCLLGAAYTKNRREKAQLYLRAVQSAERALFTNPEFRARIEAGASRDEAAQALGEQDLHAMHFWATALSYYFKECLNPLRFPFNMKWMNRSTSFMERMLELDPDWNNGAIHFARGIYFLALPSFAGGDMERSRASLEQAIAVAPTSLLARWGRAKYYHVKTGNRSGFIADLEWVLAQDPKQAASPYPWNVYFQNDASLMLERVDRYF